MMPDLASESSSALVRAWLVNEGKGAAAPEQNDITPESHFFKSGGDAQFCGFRVVRPRRARRVLNPGPLLWS